MAALGEAVGLNRFMKNLKRCLLSEVTIVPASSGIGPQMKVYSLADRGSPAGRLLQLDAKAEVTIDLAAQTLTLPGGGAVEFPIDAFARHCLLEGVDELGYILAQKAAIAAYEAQREGAIDTRVG